MAEIRPYMLPIHDISEALKPYVPPKPWEPKVGDIVITMRAFKVVKDNGDGWLEVCDDNGNCLTASKKELFEGLYKHSNKEFFMKAMKDAVLTVAKQLAKANNTVTTLEIKTELRRDYPYYYWTQDIVSNYMSQLAGDGIFTYTDNGVYRTYSLVTPNKATAPTLGGTGMTTTSRSASSTLLKISGKISTKGGTSTRRNSRTIDKSRAFQLAGDPNFESVTIQGNVIGKISIKLQKKSPQGYLTPTKLQKVDAITVGGKTFRVK